MTLDLVDTAQRATYQISKTASQRLRRLTNVAGLNSDNIVSRLAISVSLREPVPKVVKPPAASTGKEIKGLTLLGRRRSAALLVGLICQQYDDQVDFDQLRNLIRLHWERGLATLDERADGRSVTTWLAGTLLAAPGGRKVSRDEIAKSLGRQYGRWPLEVRRLVANAGRLEIDRSFEVARKLEEQVAIHAPNQRLSEALALEVLRDTWGINRIGLNVQDRQFLERLWSEADIGILQADLTTIEREMSEYLLQLGLIKREGAEIRVASTLVESRRMWSLR